MPASPNPRNYPDIVAVLDEAVARGGVRYTVESDKAAENWRKLAYHVRKLLQKEADDALPKGVVGPSPYDGLYILLEGATCVIQFRSAPAGRLTTLDKLPITPQTKKYEPRPTDELVEIADKVKKDLGL